MIKESSRNRLKGVHSDLVKVVERAASIFDGSFIVIQGVRSAAEQKKNIANGKSQTSRSRHVVASNKCGLACAIDLAPLLADGKTIPWKQWNRFEELNAAMMVAAKAVGVPLEWGGNWKSLKDGDHWQLPWKSYP